jgi:hypothetical protein
MRRPVSIIFLFVLLILLPALAQQPPAVSAAHQQFLQKLVDAAIERTHHTVRYDPAYVRIRSRTGMFLPKPASAPMKLFAHIAPSTSICKKTFMRICCTISRPIEINADGFLRIPTPISITVGSLI